MMIEIRDMWIGNCLINVIEWTDGEHIYLNVQEFQPGGNVNHPISDKSVYIKKTTNGITMVEKYLETLVEYIKGINIPKDGKVVISVEKIPNIKMEARKTMKNIMYFKLNKGEETSPLRDMALKYFPYVNLDETDIQADDYGQKDVLNHIIRNINAGIYDKLYIKELNDISENAIQTLGIIDGLKITNPDFEIEFRSGNVVKIHELVNRMDSAIKYIMGKVEKNIDDSTIGQKEYTDYLYVKIKCDDREIVVELPWDETIIEDDLKKAGIKLENNSDVKFVVDTSLPDKFKKIIERACEERGIYAANDISSVVLTFGMELDEEIMAVIEYTNADTTDKVMRIMNDTDGFKFIEGAKSLEDIGRYWVTSDMESSVDREIDKYMDYTALGRDIMKDYEGKFVEGGCVLNRGEVDIDQLFAMDEDIEEGMGGMQGM